MMNPENQGQCLISTPPLQQLSTMLNIYNTQYPFDPNMHVPNVLGAPTQFPSQRLVQQRLPAVSEQKPVLGQQTRSPNRKKIRRCHPVWEYFRLWQQEGKARQSATAHCKLCRRFEIPGATSQAATRHLKGMHREEYYKLFAVPINNNMITNTEHQPLRAKFSGLTIEFPDEKPQEEKPRSSIQLSPISMESPWSPPLLKMEEPQPEEEQRANAPMPDPKSPHGCWMPGFEASLHGLPGYPYYTPFQSYPMLNSMTNMFNAQNAQYARAVNVLGTIQPVASGSRKGTATEKRKVASAVCEQERQPELAWLTAWAALQVPPSRYSTSLQTSENVPPRPTNEFAHEMNIHKAFEMANLPPIKTPPTVLPARSTPVLSSALSELSAQKKPEMVAVTVKTEPGCEDRETENLLKMFTKHHHGFYECNRCTFCASYDLNALRAHQETTHRAQNAKVCL
ncbi:unnamed protein product, partial [Mesorhabditis spiculigera]